MEAPELENGDRLTRAEFERRYEAMPHLKKAELIEGVVHMPSPVRQQRHSRPHHSPLDLAGYYEASTPGVEAGDNGSIRLDLDNEPQPDAYLFIDPRVRRPGPDQRGRLLEGAPELVAEVATSSVSYDLGTSSRPIAATASANTWSGACSTARLTGSCSARAATSRWRCRRRHLPQHGLSRSLARPCRRSWSGDLARVLAVVQEGLNARSMPISWPGWTSQENRPPRSEQTLRLMPSKSARDRSHPSASRRPQRPPPGLPEVPPRRLPR